MFQLPLTLISYRVLTDERREPLECRARGVLRRGGRAEPRTVVRLAIFSLFCLKDLSERLQGGLTVNIQNGAVGSHCLNCSPAPFFKGLNTVMLRANAW